MIFLWDYALQNSMVIFTKLFFLSVDMFYELILVMVSKAYLLSYIFKLMHYFQVDQYCIQKDEVNQKIKLDIHRWIL